MLTTEPKKSSHLLVAHHIYVPATSYQKYRSDSPWPTALNTCCIRGSTIFIVKIQVFRASTRRWVTDACILPRSRAWQSATHVLLIVLGQRDAHALKPDVRKPPRNSMSLRSWDGRRSHDWQPWDWYRKQHVPTIATGRRPPDRAVQLGPTLSLLVFTHPGINHWTSGNSLINQNAQENLEGTPVNSKVLS